MINYRIHVVGKLNNGHPIQFLGQDFDKMCAEYDRCVANYPFNKVVFTMFEESPIKESKPIRKPLPIKCPKGHKGLIDGKAVVIETREGTYNCKVCGEIFNG